MTQVVDEEVLELLQRWSGLSDAQRLAFNALMTEIDVTSNLIETSTDKLSLQFQTLAFFASQQSRQITEIMQEADHIEVDGEFVHLDETVEILNTNLEDMVRNVVKVSKAGMSMAYDLDDLVTNMEQVTVYVEELEEATREKAELSEIMEKVSVMTEVASSGVSKCRSKLREITMMDLSENMMAKYRVDELLGSILAQNEKFNTAIAETAKTSEETSKNVSQMITSIQFQDRTSQRLQHIRDSLETIGQMLKKLDDETDKFIDNEKTDAKKEELLTELINSFHLAEVKERFIRATLRGEQIDEVEESPEVAHSDASDDVDLF